MNLNEQLNLMNSWYHNLDVLYNFIKLSQNRELAFFTPKGFDFDFKGVRNIRGHSCQFIQKAISIAGGFVRHPFNIYYSVSEFKGGVPFFPMINRNTKFWNEEAKDHIIDYPLFIDVDGSFNKMGECFETAKNVFDWFKENSLPFEARFSGRGFHFIVPSMFLEKGNFEPFDKNSVYFKRKELALCIKDQCDSFNNIDTTIYDHRRVLKMPYSLVFYPDRVMVCWPFHSEKEFLDFNHSNFRVENINQKNIKNRGTKLL